MSIIRFNEVNFKYPGTGKFALEKINLNIMEGEFFAVMGESGAGKTTLCKLVNGIIPHLCEGNLTGAVIVDGGNTIDCAVSSLASKVGMVLDDPDAQLFTSTVRQEAAFGPENLLLNIEEIESRVKSALRAVGLDGFENRIPSSLSGGEKQRLSIAAALAMQGKILCLDDPLCRLDPAGAREVISVLRDLREKRGITIIMTSYDSNVIAQNVGRVCILKNGRVAALDTAKNIFADGALLEENGIQPLSQTECGIQFFNNYQAANNAEIEAVKIENFCFTYPNGISIENISLSIADNDFTAITGNNGCGKTTLLKSVTGLLRPRSGDIFIRGRNTKEMTVSDICAEAGFVMQNPDTQLFTDSVYNEVSFALKNTRGHKRLSNAEINKRVDGALAAAGLEDAQAFPHALCKADRVRTVIACVLATGCRIIILDEVDAGLDYHDNIKIMNLVRDLHNRGFTIIFVTHNMFLAGSYARRIIKIDKNKIAFDSASEQGSQLDEEI